MSKTAAAVLAFFCLIVFTIPMSAQLIPHGNVYIGASYGHFTDVVNDQSYRGWNGSGEAIPFARFPHIGFVFDASGFYRTGVTQYNFLGGPRLSASLGKWRPFVHVMGGVQKVNSNGIKYSPTAVDVGGGTDYKLFFKNFSWRLQGDYIHTRYASADQKDWRASTGIVLRF